MALARDRNLPAAHAAVLSIDRTPDVPIRTSDVYLEQLLDAAAKAEGEERDVSPTMQSETRVTTSQDAAAASSAELARHAFLSHSDPDAIRHARFATFCKM